MRPDSEDAEHRRPLGVSLITTWVLGTMLIVMTTFLAQFPEAQSSGRVVTAR